MLLGHQLDAGYFLRIRIIGEAGLLKFLLLIYQECFLLKTFSALGFLDTILSSSSLCLPEIFNCPLNADIPLGTPLKEPVPIHSHPYTGFTD